MRGRSINKLQNDIILLIFKICKFGNIRFVGNLIGDIHWNFYDDDIIIVTPLVLRTQSVSAFFIFIFILWGGTRSLRMPTLRPASQAGPMRNPREGTSVVLRDTIRLT